MISSQLLCNSFYGHHNTQWCACLRRFYSSRFLAKDASVPYLKQLEILCGFQGHKLLSGPIAYTVVLLNIAIKKKLYVGRLRTWRAPTCNFSCLSWAFLSQKDFTPSLKKLDRKPVSCWQKKQGHQQKDSDLHGLRRRYKGWNLWTDLVGRFAIMVWLRNQFTEIWFYIVEFCGRLAFDWTI